MLKRWAVIGLLLFVGCTDTINLDGGGGGGQTHTVKYEVTGQGTNGADMTFQNENADTSQQGGRALPWEYSFEANEGAVLYISAQNMRDVGAVTCTIYIDGAAAETNTSSGAYAICTTSGQL